MTAHDSVPIPEEIQRFILLAIPSVPYLEAMLQLRAAPGLDWDAEQMALRLYLTDKVAQDLLRQLADFGVAAAPGRDGAGFRYAPQTEHLRTMIDRLAAVYSLNLIGVSTLIHSKMNSKAHQFADAFAFRK